MENFKQDGQQKSEKETFLAVISYVIFFLPLLTNERNNSFVKYHVKQGFVIFLIAIGLFLLDKLNVPYFLITLLYTTLFVLWCIGVTYAFLGKEKAPPLIGKVSENINF